MKPDQNPGPMQLETSVPGLLKCLFLVSWTVIFLNKQTNNNKNNQTKKKIQIPQTRVCWGCQGLRGFWPQEESLEGETPTQAEGNVKEHPSADVQTRQLRMTSLGFSCLSGSCGAQSLCLAKSFRSSSPTKGWTKRQGCLEDWVFWDSVSHSKRQPKPELWRKRTSNRDFVDKGQRAEASTAYSCLCLFCCGPGKFRLY